MSHELNGFGPEWSRAALEWKAEAAARVRSWPGANTRADFWMLFNDAVSRLNHEIEVGRLAITDREELYPAITHIFARLLGLRDVPGDETFGEELLRSLEQSMLYGTGPFVAHGILGYARIPAARPSRTFAVPGTTDADAVAWLTRVFA